MVNENLVPCPAGWYFHPENPNVQVDNEVLHNGHESIRIGPHIEGIDTNVYRECWAHGIYVKPGDHVVFKVWIKTGPSTMGKDGVYGWGAAAIIDFRTADWMLVFEHSSDDPRSLTDPNWNTRRDDPGRFVPFNSNWTLRQLDFIIPDTVPDAYHDWNNRVVVDSITPDVGVGYPVSLEPWVGDQGLVWFADSELYINPVPSRTVAARSIGPFGIPESMLRQLWWLRQKFIRPEVHRKLHPLV